MGEDLSKEGKVVVYARAAPNKLPQTSKKHTGNHHFLGHLTATIEFNVQASSEFI